VSLVLHVDGDRWRTHLRATLAEQPALVPVTKGNGYGFGNGRLARRAGWLGVDALAVGTYDELPDVATRFAGDLVVLTPWRPFDVAAREATADDALADRLVHTVGRLEDLEALAALPTRPRVLLELTTSMRRHGLDAAALRAAGTAARAHGGVRLEGATVHLPLPGADHLPEMERLLTDVVAAGLPGTVWVSHLSASELADLGRRWPDLALRPRVGTDLWLGDRSALRVTAAVLDRHRVERGDVFGYRGRQAPVAGTILVVSGGTAHGIGLEAPTGQPGVRARAASLARGGLDAVGLARSPYTVGGKQRLFAEPPHMQSSMLFLPAGADVPDVGSEVDVRVRYTATAFDRVEIS
jgi:hypothetical protein